MRRRRSSSARSSAWLAVVAVALVLGPTSGAARVAREAPAQPRLHLKAGAAKAAHGPPVPRRTLRLRDRVTDLAADGESAAIWSTRFERGQGCIISIWHPRTGKLVRVGPKSVSGPMRRESSPVAACLRQRARRVVRRRGSITTRDAPHGGDHAAVGAGPSRVEHARPPPSRVHGPGLLLRQRRGWSRPAPRLRHVDVRALRVAALRGPLFCGQYGALAGR